MWQICSTRKRKHAPSVNGCGRNSNSRYSRSRIRRKIETLGSDKIQREYILNDVLPLFLF